MKYQHLFFPETRFGGFTEVDVTIAFYNRVNALINPSDVVIDFGCGEGACLRDSVPLRRNLRVLRGKAARVIGLDVDAPAAARNRAIDEFHPLEPGAPWPVGDASADLILSDCVLEHLPDPEAFFSEARRILKPGTGLLCIRTPNVWSYVGVASRLAPNRLHASILKKAQPYRIEDVFPTVYRCNTLSKMRAMMKRYGFDAVVYGAESEPGYLEFSKIAYGLGVLHRKLAPSLLRPVIFAFGRRV